MSRGAHFNRAARRSGGDIRFRLEGPSIGVDASWLVVALAKVRHELGQAAVVDFIAEMRKRGDLECTDEQAEELAKP
jgi:hypothetical protein